MPGLPPDLSKPIPGCAFAPRCEFAAEACRQEDVRLTSVGPDHHSACLRVQRNEITL
jgi:oligopeptide transport system ATP-binding protein